MNRWVMMDGPAGAGKSTLAAALVAGFRAAGQTADLFGEEQLFTRPEFADVARGFRTKCFSPPTEFETAYGDYLAGTTDDWAVFDWSAAGMAGDLPWALRDRAAYIAHLRRVSVLDPYRRLTLLQFTVDPRIATERAATQRGEKWLERNDRLALDAGITGADRLDRIARRAEQQLAPAAAELAAALAAGWRIVEIDAAQPPAAVERAARLALAAPIW